MNSGSIVKFEYRLFSQAEFSEINFTAFTGTISKGTQQTDAGAMHTTKINLKVPEVTSDKTALLDSLLFQKAQYRVTDYNGAVHLVGDASYPARLEYEQAVDAQPGSWNGYTVAVNHISPYSYALS